jgi:LysR family hydrogen peroxide-inducible transcriptional activator
MDLRQLAALVAVAETGSFTAAARTLHTAQSNVSAHIARLERELKSMLVDRSSGTMTEEGVAAVERARRVQREIEALVADVAALRDEVVGDVRVGVIGTVGRWLVPLVLEDMAARHPRVVVTVVDATTTSLLPRLAADSLDLAVVNLPIGDPDVVTEPLFDEERILVAPDGHPLAGRERVSLVELADHELLLEPRGTSFRDALDAEAAAAGVELRSKADVDGLRLVASLAFEGFGAAIVPTTAAPRWLRGPWTRLALDGVPTRSVGLARRRRTLLAAPGRALRDVLRSTVAEHAPATPGLEVTLT